MTEIASAPPKQWWPPDTIGAEPFTLDGVQFTPQPPALIERADRDGDYVGDVLRDEVPNRADPSTIEPRWLARKVHPQRGELSDWMPMRCVHEARAYLVSVTRWSA